MVPGDLMRGNGRVILVDGRSVSVHGESSKGHVMQSKNIAVADRPGEGRPPADLPAADGAWSGRCARRRAARRVEVDRDHRLVTRGLIDEVSRVLADQGDSHPELLIEQIEAALAASRADYQRLNNTRINLRGDRGARFEDSVPLPAALVVYGHRGNYHGVHTSMDALGSLFGPLLARPDGAIGHISAVSVTEELHRRCEIWTLELSGVVHVFARPGSDADTALAGTGTRMSRAPAWPLRTPLTIV